MRRIALVGTLIGVVGMGGCAHADVQVALSATVIEIDRASLADMSLSGETPPTTPTIAGVPILSKTAHETGVARIVKDDASLDVAGRTWALGRLRDGESRRDAPIRIVAAPTLVTMLGEKAKFGTGPMNRGYLDLDEKGAFVIRQHLFDEKHGVSMGYRPRMNADESLKIQFSLDCGRMVGREPVGKSSIPAGKPIVAKTSIETVFSMREDQLAIVPMDPFQEGGDPIFAIVIVRRVLAREGSFEQQQDVLEEVPENETLEEYLQRIRRERLERERQ